MEDPKDKNKPTPEEPKPEEPKNEEPKPEETKTPDYAEAIAEIKKGYEEKIIKITNEAQEKIAKRDAVIKQLLVDGKGDDAPQTIAEKINEKRKSLLKKW